MAKASGYSLTIPMDLYIDLRNLASRQGLTVEALLGNAIEWQYILASINEKDGELFIRYPGKQLEKIELRSKK